jgi:hypothetical protein
MKLQLQRNPSDSVCTIGTLYIDGVQEAFTLEDVVREVAGQPVASWKIKNETAIPRGTYKLGLHNSPHFGRVLPHLLNVPGYDYVLIHWGNWAKDTEGCILVGDSPEKDAISQSKVAFDELWEKLEAPLTSGQDVHIEVQ